MFCENCGRELGEGQTSCPVCSPVKKVKKPWGAGKILALIFGSMAVLIVIGFFALSMLVSRFVDAGEPGKLMDSMVDALNREDGETIYNMLPSEALYLFMEQTNGACSEDEIIQYVQQSIETTMNGYRQRFGDDVVLSYEPKVSTQYDEEDSNYKKIVNQVTSSLGIEEDQIDGVATLEIVLTASGSMGEDSVTNHVSMFSMNGKWYFTTLYDFY